MNFLDCVPNGDKGPQLYSVHGNWSLPISQPIYEKICDRGPAQLSLGIRPEDLEIDMEPRPGSLAGQVFVSELLGDRTIVDISLGESRVKVKAPPTIHIEPSQPVWLTPNINRLHIFDKATDEFVL